MKKLTTLILFLLAAQFSYGQLDNTTKNKIKAYYFTAENLYEKGEYSKVLDKIGEIESNGVKVATSQNLKIKTLVKLKQYQKAKEELDVLYSLNPSKEIYEQIAEYSSVIDTGIEFKKNQLTKDAMELKKQNARIDKASFGIKGLSENLGLYVENFMYGIINSKGVFIVPLKYYSVRIHNNFFLMSKRNADLHVVDIYTEEGLWKSDVFSEAVYNSQLDSKFTIVKQLIVIRSKDNNSYLFDTKHNKYVLKNMYGIATTATNGVLEYWDQNDNDKYIDISGYLD